jgi:hypothetical protein
MLQPNRHPYGWDAGSWLVEAQGHMRAAMILGERQARVLSGEGIVPRQGGGGVITDDWWLIDVQLHRQAFFLAAMAIELALKAVIIRREADLLQQAARSPRRRLQWTAGTGHELVDLANRAGFTPPDAELLTTLQEFSIWKGRYPLSNRWESLYDSGELPVIAGTHSLEMLLDAQTTFGLIRDLFNSLPA